MLETVGKFEEWGEVGLKKQTAIQDGGNHRGLGAPGFAHPP